VGATALFEDPVGAHLVFKGGTSLSKAHRLIERFSEDLDLTYDIPELAGDLLPRGAGGEVLDIPETRAQIRRVSDAIRNERLPAWVRGYGCAHHPGPA
jgi:predicted nucleotidyltransferase component of viral defense system